MTDQVVVHTQHCAANPAVVCPSTLTWEEVRRLGPSATTYGRLH